MKTRRIVVFLFILALLFSGCSASVSKSENQYAVGTSKGETSLADSQVSDDSSSGRKIIITAEFQVETSDFSNAVQALLDAVTRGGGYVESMQQSGGADADGSGTYVLRIPAAEIDSFANEIDKIGTVIRRTQDSQDITDAYYDVEARLQAKKIQHSRILALMEKAESLSDLLQLEQELAEIQAEIDGLTGKQQQYDKQVDYATVTVRLWQAAVAQNENETFGSQAAKALRDSFAVALTIVKGIGLAIIWLLPYLIAAAVVIFIILFATRKKRRARKAAKASAQRPVPQQPVPPPQQEPENPYRPQ
ncbi:MAG: DUF4349 domain-containing protein [Firmicutes bacterium]|nr:DUF4349 domain-containing protein [Bacillota bacterium]